MKRSNLRLLAVLLIVAPACAHSTRENSVMVDSSGGAPSISRPAPPNVPPIQYKGVRYQQDMEAFRHGGTQRGGYLVAVDPTSGARLWMLEVYPVAKQPPGAPETPGIYFRSMSLVPGKDELEIVNEVGATYRVDLVQRTSTWVSGPR